MTETSFPPELEQRLRWSVAEARLHIGAEVQGPDPETRLVLIGRLAAVLALGTLVAGFSILAVFIVLNLVFHFSPG